MLTVHHQHTHKRHRKTATHQCFYWWCTEEYLTTRSEPTCFCHHQLLLFVMVTHSHSISMHTPNAFSLLQTTPPWILVFALGLLILHHRYEQHILKETWQWFHPWVPQCAWTWLSETTHLTKYHIWMILRIHGCINDIKCERVRRAWTQLTFLKVQKAFTVMPKILSRVLHKDSRGGGCKNFRLVRGGSIVQKDSSPSQTVQKDSSPSSKFAKRF